MKTPSLPPINLASDGHVHTRLCNHAVGEMEDYVIAAIQCELTEIIFLEHLEAGISTPERTWLNDEDFDYYFREGDRLREAYKDKIAIGTGVELGYNQEYENELLEKLASRPWDRVGISCHFLKIPGTQEHINLLSRKSTSIAKQLGVNSLLSSYLETLILAVKNIPGDVLCHLDAALRHVPGVMFTEIHMKQVDMLLATVKQRGMSLELNTSGIPMRNEVFPSKKMLTMALAYDIPLLAGSDAHQPQDVGRFFSILPDIITSATCP